MAADENYGGRLTTTARIVHAQPVPVPPIPDRIRISANTITLDQVRTGPRPTNDYVDNPTNTRPAVPPRRSNTLVGNNVHTPVPPGEQQSLLTQPVVFQPVSTGGLKLPSTQINRTRKDVETTKHPHVTENEDHAPSESIICHKCGKCKCQQCTQRRELPSRWVCNGKFNCSATEVVEMCTCLCFVKGFFYHCCKNNEGDCGESVSDDPCACCERPSCFKRWSCLGLLTLCLPCLACYWPMRCGVSACTTCYNLCTRRGCHCSSSKSVTGQNGKRFLLVESESSSA